MGKTFRTSTLVAAGLGMVIAGGAGYGAYKFAKQRADERAAVRVVGETTAQLRTVLKTPSAEAAAKIEHNLELARGWSNVYMADAAEHYLVGAREIAKRRADAARHAQHFAVSRAALAAHMRQAGQRGPGWIGTASQLKKQLERAHFELETSLNALAQLLASLPDAQKRLTPYVDTSLILDDALRLQARQRALDELKRATLDLEKARSLAPRF
jgi:hypothetical protein